MTTCPNLADDDLHRLAEDDITDLADDDLAGADDPVFLLPDEGARPDVLHGAVQCCVLANLSLKNLDKKRSKREILY
jgi:hypothetical protein